MQGEFQSKTHLLAILDNMPFMAWYKDARGKFIAINQPFADAIGRPREEIIGKTDFDVWPYELALSYVADDNEVMQSAAKKTVEEKINDASGGVWFETFKSPVFDEQGNVSGTIGMARDISQRVHFQLALEEQKQFIRSMIDASPDFIFFKDINSVYLGCNHAFAHRFIGSTEEEIIGKTDLYFVKNPAQAEQFRQLDQKVFAQQKTLIIEEVIQLTDGTFLDIETAKTPFYNKEGHLEGLIGVARDITARKRFEKQLQEQIDYSQMLLQTIPTGVYTLDNDKNITSWNTMAEIITGYTAPEVLGKYVEDFPFHPFYDDCDLFTGVNTAAPANMTCKIKHKSGQTKYIFKTLDVLRNTQGEVIGQIECFDDITEKMAVEEQLKESQIRLSLATTSTRIGMWDWKIPTGGLVLNEQWASIRGYTLKELEPITINTWTNSTHPDDFEKAMNIIQRCFTGELDYYECEIRMKHKSGHWIWVLDRGKIIEWDKDQKPLRMVGTHIDITERKNSEEELRKREKLLAAVALSIKELIENRDYIKAAASCFELIGEAAMVDRVYLFANRQDNHGKFYVDQVVKWNAPTTTEEYDNATLQNIPLEDLESLMSPLIKGEAYYSIVRDLKNDGVRQLLEAQNILSFIMLPIIVRGNFWGFVGFDECKYERYWSDSEFSTLSAFANSLEKTIERSLIESELEAAKQSAEAANELKSQFVANMSHEIRTPMHAILGYASLLREDIENEQKLDYLNAIQKAGYTLMNLINDVLDLSKIEAGQLNLETGEVVISRLFEEIRNIFSLRLEEKKLTLRLEVDPLLSSTLLLDEVRTRQILLNLVGNAVKFTETGAVSVSAAAQYFDAVSKKLDLVLKVSDTGIGIPKDQQKLIFEPFKQKDGQSNNKYGGTGLGLSISKKLAEMMRGSIEVESTPNLGSVFTVTIPGIYIKDTSPTLPAEESETAIYTATPPTDSPCPPSASPLPSEMAEELELLRQGLWLECSKTNRINDVKKLAEQLQSIGDSYQHEGLQDFAKNLQGSAESYDLKHIKTLLEQFPRMLDCFKENLIKGGDKRDD